MMIKVKEVWLTDNAVWIKTDKGEEACEQFVDYPRLKYATPEQLQNYEVNEYGIHWKEIDEDLSFEGFFNKQPTTELYRLFIAHPELNVSALARRMGITQSLMAQYISGNKTPSKERLKLIYETLHELGRELIAV